MYYVLTDSDGFLLCLHRKLDNAGIPIDESNKDYQEFLEWNAKQDTPIVVPDSRPEAPVVMERKKACCVLEEFLDLKSPDLQQCADAIKALVRR